MRALIVEPNPDVAQAIGSVLLKAKLPADIVDPQMLYEMTQAEANLDAYSAVMIGDIPSRAGVVGQLRMAHTKAALIVLLAHKSAGDAIELFSAGADDVVVKPFNGAEMAARIRAILRRGFHMETNELTIGRITAHLDGRDPEVDGTRLKLSHREHSIFMHLAMQAGRVVSKESVYNAVYGTVDMQPHDKVIDVYICKLRKKIAEATSGEQYIETVYGRGYKFDLPAKTSAGRTRFGKPVQDDAAAEPETKRRAA